LFHGVAAMLAGAGPSRKFAVGPALFFSSASRSVLG
jgi:hypothetical protein